MPTVRELLARASRRLAEAALANPSQEAALLLRTLLGMSPSALLAHDQNTVESELALRFDQWIARRAAGEPTAYLRGFREFYGRDFAVDARVLVPRPETEHLVEIALELPLPERARVLELGTGSGIVAISLAAERPLWRLVATEVSVAALAVARANAARHGVADRIAFVASDLGTALRLESFDLAVANLPYVDERERGYLGLDHEPQVALFAAESGRQLIEKFRIEAAALPAGAYFACEIGASQAYELLDGADPAVWERGEMRRDLAGLDRNLIWRRSAAPGR